MTCELCVKGKAERNHNCLRHSDCAPNENQLWNPGACEECKELFSKSDNGCSESRSNIKFITGITRIDIIFEI